MKLIRFGNPGNEKPGLEADGVLYDVSERESQLEPEEQWVKDKSCVARQLARALPDS